MKQTTTIKRPIRSTVLRAWVMFIMTFAFCLSLLAQEKIVTGTIKDASGQSLPGVNVSVKGTTTGIVSDIDGKFTLKVPGNSAVLLVTYVGYKNQEINVGESNAFNIILEEDVQQMDEVVVVGYGVQKKKLVTGATVQVKNEDLVRNKVTRVESALQGLTPGMLVVKQSGQPGADFNISIRGLSSINGNSPLVLIDGVPGSLSTLNPEDIESVDVLKDAASAAIYGSRAGNGVVLVTTKKGKSGEMQISYDGYYGISNPAKKIEMLNAKEYAEIMNEAQFNTDPKKAPFFTDDYINSLGEGTNWQDEAYVKNAKNMSHYIGINGGNDKSSFSISMSYKKEEGVFNLEDKSYYERFGFRVNSDHQVKKYLKFGENLTYTHKNNRSLGNGNQYNNFLHDLFQASPLIPAYDPAMYDGYGRSKFQDQQINPIASIHYNYNGYNHNDDVIGDFYGELTILPGLKFRSDFGGTLSFAYNSNASDTFHLTPYTYRDIPEYNQNMERRFGYNFDNILTYEKSIGEHSIIAMIGTNAQDNWYYNTNATARGYLSADAPVLTNVTNLDTAIVSGDFGKGDSRYSYFGRLSYNYAEKWLATVSLRRDVSSRFGPEKRIGYFPAFSLGYVVTKEDLFQTNWLEFLKIRGSWGQNGKEPPLPYQFLATIGANNRYYTLGSSKYVGISPNVYPNEGLKWEASEQINIGFDSKFFKNFTFSLDLYEKTSKDWIMQVPVAGIIGISGISNTLPYANGGNVSNKGVELDLGYAKKFGDLFLEMRANFSYNKNKVTSIPGKIIHGSTSVLYNGSEEFYRVEEGYPIGYFWGYTTAGIFQDSAEVANQPKKNGKLLQSNAKPGDVRFVDLNGDTVLNEKDKSQIGDPNPHYIYGFNFSASYKGFDFSVNFSGQGGNQIVQSYRAQERYFYNFTQYDYDNRWTGPGTSNKYPRVVIDDKNNNWRKFSDLYLHDGDFLRVKSVSIGYDFKNSILKNTPIQQFRLYVTATNLFTFTSYNGVDPEIGYGSYYNADGVLNDAYATGIDLGNYPVSRTYMIGVNVKF